MIAQTISMPSRTLSIMRANRDFGATGCPPRRREEKRRKRKNPLRLSIWLSLDARKRLDSAPGICITTPCDCGTLWVPGIAKDDGQGKDRQPTIRGKYRHP